MTERWEYHAIETSVSNEWSPKKRARELEELTRRLNDLGAEGWELAGYGASVVPSSLSSVGVCLLKRRLSGAG